MKLKTTGHYVTANLTLDGHLSITLDLNEQADSIEQINQMDKDQLLSIEIKPYRKPRSLDANAMLWACIKDMQTVLGGTKMEIYKKLVQRYGQYDVLSMKKVALPMIRNSFRVVEVILEYIYNDEAWVDAMCYYGTSTYNSKDFSVLLEGVIDEMHELGLKPPPSKDIQKGLELWENKVSATRSSDT